MKATNIIENGWQPHHTHVHVPQVQRCIEHEIKDLACVRILKGSADLIQETVAAPYQV